MIPTITGLVGGKPANDTETAEGIKVVRKAANDESEAYVKTLDRILARHNAHDKPRGTAANDQVDAYATTMERIISQTGDSKYSNKGFLRRRTGINDNSGGPIPDAIMAPNAVDHDGMYEETINRIMDKHNGHGVERPAPANDEDFQAELTMERIRKKYMQMPEEVPEYDNDRRLRGKRVIHTRNKVEPARKKAKLADAKPEPVKSPLNEDQEISTAEQLDPSSKKKRKKKKGEDSDVEVADTPEILGVIAENTMLTAEGVNELNKKISDMLDDMGVDSLARKERDLEGYGGSRPNNKDKGSGMAPEGKEKDKEKDKTLQEKIAKFAGSGLGFLGGLGVMGLGGLAKFLGEMAGGETNVTPGGGFDGEQQTPKDRADAPGRKGGEYKRRTPVQPSGGKGTSLENKARVAKALRGAGDFNDSEIAQVMAQIEAESAFKPRSEDLNYSASTLRKLFGKKLRQRGVSAESVASKGPVGVGNFIYGGRMGNAQNEGYKYRGRGMIQLTGKENYRRMGQKLGLDLVTYPDLANDPEIASQIALEYFRERRRHGIDISTARGATKAVAPQHWKSKIGERGRMAENYGPAQIDSLMNVQVRPTKGSGTKGQRLNQQSVQNVTNVVNNVQVMQGGMNSMSGTNRSNGPRTPPPARSSSWDLFTKYFSF